MKISGIELKSEEEQQKEFARQAEFLDEAREIVSGITKDIGRPLFFNLTSFGCQMNFKCKITNSCTAGGSFIHCT